MRERESTMSSHSMYLIKTYTLNKVSDIYRYEDEDGEDDDDDGQYNQGQVNSVLGITLQELTGLVDSILCFSCVSPRAISRG